MRYYIIVVSLFLLNISVSLANLKEVVENTTKEYLSTRFVNATFLFADSKEHLVVGAKGVFSLYGEQLRPNQEMPIGASTKPIIAAAILRLQDKGLLNVQDKIFQHIEQEYWPKGVVPYFAKEITIHNLLTHTSGLPEYNRHIKTDFKMSQRQINKHIIKFIASKSSSLKAKINKYNYSNSNFIILGMIIEKVSKQDLRNFLHEEFFKPLKMTSTTLATFKQAKEMQKNSVISYYPLRYYVEPNNGKPQLVLIDSLFPFSPKFPLIPYADGGIISNVFDLIKWQRALHQGKILSASSYKLMTTKHYLVNLQADKVETRGLLDNPMKKKNAIINLNQKLHKTYTGYGILVAELDNQDIMFHHPGGSTGFGVRSEVGYIPAQDLYFAILSNVVVRIPNEIQTTIDMNNVANQLDISYFREAIVSIVRRLVT